MASQTNAEELYTEINTLLFDVCHFLTLTLHNEGLSPKAKIDAQNLVSRSKDQVDAILKMQNGQPNDVDGSNSTDEQFPFPHNDLKPWDLPQCSTKYGPLVTNERVFLIGPKRTVFVALVDCYLLFYKVNKNGEGPSDWINVMDYTARALENRKDFAFEIIASGKQRFEFMARTSKDVEQWIVAINYKKKPVMISNIPESILESDLGEYWEVEEFESEEPQPSRSNNFVRIEQSSIRSATAYQTNSLSPMRMTSTDNNNIIVDQEDCMEEPEYHSIMIPHESNRAKYSVEVQHVHEQIPQLPERMKTDHLYLKNKKLYGMPEVELDQSFPNESTGIKSPQLTLTKQSSYLYSQNSLPDDNTELEGNIPNFALNNVRPYQDTFPINTTDVSKKIAAIQEINESKEIIGKHYKDRTTNTHSSTKLTSNLSSRSNSWRKELPVLSNDNRTTDSAKPNNFIHSSISKKPNKIENIEERKSFQQLRQEAELRCLNQKN